MKILYFLSLLLLCLLTSLEGRLIQRRSPQMGMNMPAGMPASHYHMSPEEHARVMAQMQAGGKCFKFIDISD